MPSRIPHHYDVADWLKLHNLKLDEARKYTRLLEEPQNSRAKDEVSFPPQPCLHFDFTDALEKLVQPALIRLLNLDPIAQEILANITLILHQKGDIALPYTEYCKAHKKPIVHMIWNGRGGDVICLAHELAHAQQMILSKYNLMPPVAREICAFLGELSLIGYAQEQSETLYRALQSVWQKENIHYFGEDVKRLSNALKATSCPYNYRHNYPLARAASIYHFSANTAQANYDLFSSGTQAMAKISFDRVFREFSNHLDK